MSSDQEIMLDLYNSLQKILMFTRNMSKQEFINDEKTQSSVLYQWLSGNEAGGQGANELEPLPDKLFCVTVRAKIVS